MWRTDGQTDRFAIAYSALSMLSRANKTDSMDYKMPLSKHIRIHNGPGKAVRNSCWQLQFLSHKVKRGSYARLCYAIYSVSQKISPWGFVTIFPKRLGISRPNFTRLLRVPIYDRLRIFIQLSATLTKLCHNKVQPPTMRFGWWWAFWGHYDGRA